MPDQFDRLVLVWDAAPWSLTPAAVMLAAGVALVLCGVVWSLRDARDGR